MTQYEPMEIFKIHFGQGHPGVFACNPDNKQFKDFLRSKTRKYWQDGETEADGTRFYEVYMPEGMSKAELRQQLHELALEKPFYELLTSD